MELAIQDDGLFLQGRKGWGGERAFDYIRALGVTRIRVNLLWSYTMGPKQYGARRKPSRIYYPFGQVDELIDKAASTLVFTNTRSQSERWFQACQSACTLRQTRLTVSLPTAAPNKAESARRTRRVLVPDR